MSIYARLIAVWVMVGVCLGLWAAPAQAMVRIDHQFVADTSCAAVSSIRRGTNPGNVRVQAGQTFHVIGKNKEDATHYLIEVNRAEPADRWIPVGCGHLQDALPIDNPPTSERRADDYLLALSWQPAFCETKPSKPECKTQSLDRFDSRNLAIHGLWPQPSFNIYCNVSDKIKALDKAKQWSELPDIALSNETRKELAEKMPGFASNLHLHEWYKHGTCYSGSPEEYFTETILLQDQVNTSGVRELFAETIGDSLTSSEIRDRFDEAFGDGAGDRVFIKCARDIDGEQENMIVELWLNLKGNIEPTTSLKTLLQEGKVVEAGCPLGLVDPAGFN